MPKPVVIDTGSGYNVIWQDALPQGLEHHITHSADLPALGSANNNLLYVGHELWLRIQLSDSLYPVRFKVVNRLACQVLLGTHFLDQHVDAIKCKQRVLYLSRSIVPVPAVGKVATPHQERAASRQHGARARDQPPRIQEASSICSHRALPTTTLTPVYTG